MALRFVLAGLPGLLLLFRLLLLFPRGLLLANVDPCAVLLQRVAAVRVVDLLAPLPGLGLLVGAVAGVERVLLRADHVLLVGLLVVQKPLAGGGLRDGEVDLEALELVLQGEHGLEILPDLDGLDGGALGLLAAELLQALLAVLGPGAHAVLSPAHI